MKVLYTLGLLYLFLLASPLAAQSIILTSDQQLSDLTTPDQKIDMSLGYNKTVQSLREVCENGQRWGSKEIIVAFDEFFRQYRGGTGAERKLTPDMDEYVDKIKMVSDFAKNYDLGLCLSLLSPLELGVAYKKQTGYAGRWLAYKVGLRDAKTGKFHIPVWHQLYWTNNKGKSPVLLTGVKAYAFRESGSRNSPFRVVNPDDIIQLNHVKYEASDTLKLDIEMRLIQVYSDAPELPGYDRVMVMLEYETQEMDYFNDNTPVFLKNLLKKYHDKGVNLSSLYSDEMHIQQDWSYFSHHENGQFAQRYLTKSMAEAYSKKYNQPFDDKYMLYFVYGAPYYEPYAASVLNVQYVMGAKPEDIHRTFLMRDRYYKMLSNGVVDLFKDAKDYAETLFKRELKTHAHASWAESPTIDLWNTEKLHTNAHLYEYTSNYVWGNTVHQAASACSDYFKWGEYLQPTGNDFAECGWNDRNYYGAAMAASIGVINKYPNAYAAAWGMPDQVLERRMAINHAFGAQPPMPISTITAGVHRDVEVLALYPMNLVAAEERFGSWMNQYGYANYLTAEMLMKLGELLPDGKIKVKEKTYGTLVAMFELFPEKGLLDMMERFVENGGRVVWFSVPPMLDSAGEDCTAQWRRMFGLHYQHDRFMGEIAAGREITFCNQFANVPTQTILTDFLVDRIYPVEVSGGQAVAKCGDKIVGVTNAKGKGAFYYFGFRPRDDQSQSLGYETRTMFEILNATGAYPATGRFAGINDNPSYVSRTSDYFVTAFPNTATMIVRHYRTHPESWEGGFSRNAERDAQALAKNPLPSDRVELQNAKINGHEITYQGRLWLAFRTDSQKRLTAFIGNDCKAFTLDGTTFQFSDKPLDKVIFFPETEGSSIYKVMIAGEGRVTLPLPLQTREPVVKMGEQMIEAAVAGGKLVLNIDASLSGKWLNVNIK
jgi:hypothetical protein